MKNKFYCSQKFWWLTVDPQKRSIASCCAASPHKVDLTWLRNNPGNLFNLPDLVKERQDMLDNIPVASCEDSCWSPEARGLASRRMIMEQDAALTSTVADVKLLNINLGNDCNMTCSYCGKFYSTAWLRDIKDKGIYLDEDRFKLTANDHVILKLGQKKIKASDSYTLLLEEAIAHKHITKIEITGGEPFLFNGLIDLVNKLSCEVVIYTGLGVGNTRFCEILTGLPKHIKFTISAENLGKLYEFNRFGNTYENFLTNVNTIIKMGYDYNFSSVLSNLTIHGYKEFQNTLGTTNDVINFCTDPSYLSINLVDNTSKQIINQVQYNKLDQEIKSSLQMDYAGEQKTKLKIYLIEFAKRRQLDLAVFPEHFINWLLME